VRRWKRRFFVLEPTTYLYYYLSSGDDEPAGCLNLDLYSECEVVGRDEFGRPHGDGSEEDGHTARALIPAPPPPPDAERSAGPLRGYRSAKGWSAVPPVAVPLAGPPLTLRLRRPDTGHEVLMHAHTAEEAVAWRAALDPSQRHRSLRSRVAALEAEAGELRAQARGLDDDLQASRIAVHECRKALAAERAFRRDLAGRLGRELGAGLRACGRGRRFNEGVAEEESRAAQAKELAEAEARDNAALLGGLRVDVTVGTRMDPWAGDGSVLAAGFTDAIAGAFVPALGPYHLSQHQSPNGRSVGQSVGQSALGLDPCPWGDSEAAAAERADALREYEGLLGYGRTLDAALDDAKAEAAAAAREASCLRAKLATLARHVRAQEARAARLTEANGRLAREKRLLAKECRRLAGEAGAARAAAKASHASAKQAARAAAADRAKLAAATAALAAASFGAGSPGASAEGGSLESEDRADAEAKAGVSDERCDAEVGEGMDAGHGGVPYDESGDAEGARDPDGDCGRVAPAARLEPSDLRDDLCGDVRGLGGYDARAFRQQLRLAIKRAVELAQPTSPRDHDHRDPIRERDAALVALVDHGTVAPSAASSKALAGSLYSPGFDAPPSTTRHAVPVPPRDPSPPPVDTPGRPADSGLFSSVTSVLGSLGLSAAPSAPVGPGGYAPRSSLSQTPCRSPVREFGLFAYRVVYRGGVGVRHVPDASLPLTAASDILPCGAAFVARERRCDPAGITYVRVGGGDGGEGDEASLGRWDGTPRASAVDGGVAGWVFEASPGGVIILERGPWLQEVHARVEVAAAGTADEACDAAGAADEAGAASSGAGVGARADDGGEDSEGDGECEGSSALSVVSSVDNADSATEGSTDCEHDGEHDGGDDEPARSDRPLSPAAAAWSSSSWEVVFFAKKIGIQFKQGAKRAGAGGACETVVVGRLVDLVLFGSQRLPREGCVLVALNGEDLRGYDARAVGEKLRLATNRPLTLRFEEPAPGAPGVATGAPATAAGRGKPAVQETGPLPPPDDDDSGLP